MKVYIAAPYPERAYAVRVMAACEAVGLTVTSRWLKAPDELADEHARKDLDDVRACDLLIALNPRDYEHAGTGGRHVELGYALALGKRVLLVGERSNIFHYLCEIDQLTVATDPAAIVAAVQARDVD
jgi:nucleoside 2-deoxyribosyltransferase